MQCFGAWWWILLGLFPSLEQLQLLGTLVGHRVDDKTISSFWADFYSAKYGVDIGPAHCVENTVNLSRNLYGDFDFDGEGDGLRDGGSEPFSSVAYRASEHHSPLTIPDRRPTAGSDSSIHSQLGPYSSLTERGLSSSEYACVYNRECGYNCWRGSGLSVFDSIRFSHCKATSRLHRIYSTVHNVHASVA